MKSTTQTNFWNGEFGKDYTNRNPKNHEELNKMYIELFGIERTAINEEALKDIPRDISILEVGCNVGAQLSTLKKMGFTNIKGIELQDYAVSEANKLNPELDIRQGSGFDIPFEDNTFDLVYTSGVLIHISPNNYDDIMSEMLRVSKKYIWGFEYYAKELTEIKYRGNQDVLWKCDFKQEFLNRDNKYKCIYERHYPYISEKDSGATDYMYLLEK